jgi:meiotically up-regulated gene 157 (Mug157) protein
MKKNFLRFKNENILIIIILISILTISIISDIDIAKSNKKSISKRPNEKKFVSDSIEKILGENKLKIKDSILSEIYENCFPNTLDTTVEFDENKQDTFIITGDITAMWLRDSSFQTFPYIKYAKDDQKLKKMFSYLIQRQSKSILIDAYANAFNKEEYNSPWQNDETYKLENRRRIPAMNKKIWERKFELDSLVSTLFISTEYIKSTNDYLVFTEGNLYMKSLKRILEVIRKEMRGTDQEDKEGGPEYFFQRDTKESYDSLHQGRGAPVNSCGLVKSMFRNSDDATTFAYNIPENAFLVGTLKALNVELKKFMKFYTYKFLEFENKQNKKEQEIYKISEIYYGNLEEITMEIDSITDEVEKSIYENGVFEDNKTKEKYFAYEVDCFGNHYFMDDPGYPSLISLPFLGFLDKQNQIYINTRKRILSKKNPFYIIGLLGDGLASPHSARRNIWPLFTIMRGLTSSDENEILECLNLLKKTAEKTGFIHESVNIDNPDDYTRPWFSWANSFFGYFMNKVIEDYPNLFK